MSLSTIFGTHVADEPASEVVAWWHEHGAWDAAALAKPEIAAEALRHLSSAVLDRLPLPGQGRTPERYAALAAVGTIDLNLARLVEAHTDALAILAELGRDVDVPVRSTWGVWAAEPPNAVLTASLDPHGGWLLAGRKAWCSGASASTHALVTAKADDGPRLFAVALEHSGVARLPSAWTTPALAGSDTRSVDFDGVPATPVGSPREYVERPGFWHGAVGVAAVWHGGAVALARRLLEAGRTRELADVDLAALGAVDASLTAARSTLAEVGRTFDRDPTDRAGTAAVLARSARAVVEGSAVAVMDRVGRSLGPAPLATDESHWRRVADLQLYLRQSHGDRDLVDLGKRLVASGSQR